MFRKYGDKFYIFCSTILKVVLSSTFYKSGFGSTFSKGGRKNKIYNYDI